MIANGRAVALWGTLLPADIGAAQATANDVPVIPRTDENAIVLTRDAGPFIPAPAAGAAGSLLSIFDTPAAATAPDADAPAPGATLANQIDTIVVTLNAVAAQGVLTVVVRDGATGAGAIISSFFIGPLAAGTSQVIPIPLLAPIRGSANTETTIETTAAPAATNFCSIAWTGRITNTP